MIWEEGVAAVDPRDLQGPGVGKVGLLANRAVGLASEWVSVL